MDVDSKSIPEPTTARTVRGPIAWLTLWLLVAAGCFWFGLRDTDKSVQVSTKTVAAAQQSNYKTKDIADIREGDIVMARDEFGNDLGMKRVVEVYRRTSDHLRILTSRSPDGARQMLKTTNEHPFWIESRNTFVDAGDLRVGDTVEGPQGELQTVTLTLYEPHPNGIPVYNFQVKDYHTYFVNENGARAPPVLVHNADYVPKGRKVYRELSAYDRMRLDAGKALQPKSKRGTIQAHVQSRPTKHISASDTMQGTSRFHSGNGLAEIDVDSVTKTGTKFHDQEEVLRNLTDPDAIHNAITADEVLFEGPIPRSAINIIDDF